MRDASWSERRFRGARPTWLSLLLVALVGLAAVAVPIRPFVFMAVVVGYGLARWRTDRSSPIASALAAVLPVAAILAWGSFPQPLADPTGADCVNPVSPPAVWRFLEAFIGLATVAALVVDRRASWAELGLRFGSRRTMLFALVALVATIPVALWAGGLLGEQGIGGSFFGTYTLDVSQPAALVPAGLFAISNALAEELAYRGAMRVWLGPTLGIVGANLAQALVFGLAHSGQDFVGPVLPTAIAMVAAGFVAGAITRRSSSLAIVLAVHAAADIPIFLYWACRVA
jgi:membrane protease YdiL (CAAX protease family)